MVKYMKQRSVYIDYMRAFAIICVVIGHVSALTNKVNGEYYNVIYSFHMPLFFLIGGFFLKPKGDYSLKSWLNIIKNNAFTLLLPYFISCVVFLPFDYMNFGLIFYGTIRSLAKIQPMIVGPLWFLPTMFTARIFCEILFHIINKFKFNLNIASLIGALILFTIGFLIPHNNGPDSLLNFWTINSGFLAGGFLLLGLLIRPIFDKILKKNVFVSIGIFLVSICIYILGYISYKNSGSIEFPMEMCFCKFGPWYYCLLNGIMGSIAVISFAMIMEKAIPPIKFLLLRGENTMGIYILHMTILIFLIKLFKPLNINTTHIWGAIIYSIPTIILCMILSHFILKYVPWWFGKKLDK